MYIGIMNNGLGACISKVPFRVITSEDFRELFAKGDRTVVGFDGKFIKLESDNYELSDFEFVSVSAAHLIAGRNTLDNPIERGEIVEVAVSNL